MWRLWSNVNVYSRNLTLTLSQQRVWVRSWVRFPSLFCFFGGAFSPFPLNEMFCFQQKTMNVKRNPLSTLLPRMASTKCKRATTKFAYGENIRKIHRRNVAAYRRKLHRDFSASVTLHGYKQLVNERGWRRVTWFVVMTGFTSFAIYLFFQTLIDYG